MVCLVSVPLGPCRVEGSEKQCRRWDHMLSVLPCYVPVLQYSQAVICRAHTTRIYFNWAGLAAELRWFGRSDFLIMLLSLSISLLCRCWQRMASPTTLSWWLQASPTHTPTMLLRMRNIRYLHLYCSFACIHVCDLLRDKLHIPQDWFSVRGNYSHKGHFLAKMWLLQEWVGTPLDRRYSSRKPGSALLIVTPSVN